MPNDYDKMRMTQLVQNIHRLEWAADTTDDPKWRKIHLYYRDYCIRLLLEKFMLA
jgi:hypothetical protein